jgi:hypothetical protein
MLDEDEKDVRKSERCVAGSFLTFPSYKMCKG